MFFLTGPGALSEPKCCLMFKWTEGLLWGVQCMQVPCTALRHLLLFSCTVLVPLRAGPCATQLDQS